MNSDEMFNQILSSVGINLQQDSPHAPTPPPSQEEEPEAEVRTEEPIADSFISNDELDVLINEVISDESQEEEEEEENADADLRTNAGPSVVIGEQEVINTGDGILAQIRDAQPTTAEDLNLGVITDSLSSRDLYVDVGPSGEEDFEEEGLEEPEEEEEENTPENEAIPENSPTLTMDIATSRFSGAEWYESVQNKTINLIGAGGIGSWAAFMLGRLKVAGLVLYDDDIVEEGNMSGQCYSWEEVGEKKVNALYRLINKYSGVRVYSINRRFNEGDTCAGITICGLDNMVARRTCFNSWRTVVNHQDSLGRKKCLFIDGRLTLDMFQIFCIQGDDSYNIERYEREFLFSSEEAEQTTCSMKQTTYLAAMIGSMMANLFVNWVANSNDPVIPYDVPFFIEYDARNMLFRTER